MRKLIFRSLFILLVVVVVTMLVWVVVLIVSTTPADKVKPTPKPAAEKSVTLHDLTLRVPEEWQVENKNGIARAHGCVRSACGELLVYGQEALQKVNWQWEKIVGTLTCQGNTKEAPSVIAKKPATMIGDRGAYRATMERCGVSNTEKLEIWHTQIPPRLIISQRDRSLPDIDERLKRASWTA